MKHKSTAPKNTKLSVKRDGGSANKFGPKVSGNIGSKAGNDGAGTRSRADLPHETKALKAPAAHVPDIATNMKSAKMPVPGVNDKFIKVVEPWDVARDRKVK